MSEEPFRLYLVRHGVTVWNRDMRFQGHTDVPLDAEGEAQAQRLAERMQRMPHPPRVVWASDLSRAYRTAEAVAAPLGLSVQTTPALRETKLGAWEGLSRPQIVERGDAERLAGYAADPVQHPPPGGEPLDVVWARMESALAEIRAQTLESPLLLVGHGGSLRALICQALGLPVTGMRRFLLANASLTIIEEHLTAHGVLTRLMLLNDTSHLNP